eukprot:2572825-Lingulodinium_polyedra.AAC.1
MRPRATRDSPGAIEAAAPESAGHPRPRPALDHFRIGCAELFPGLARRKGRTEECQGLVREAP